MIDLYHNFFFFAAYCSCSVWGGLHILSFDGLKFDHYGECEYTLVSPHTIGISGYPNFELKGKIVKNSPLDTVSFMREVTLKYKGSTYQLKQKGVVLVNTEKVHPPYSDDVGVHISHMIGHTVSKSEILMYLQFYLISFRDRA